MANETPDIDLPPEAQQAETGQLQEYTQTVQEQAFLLGYRNGFREGDHVPGLLQWVREQKADPDISQDRLDAMRDIEEELAARGAWADDDGEITHPPGLNLYWGAMDLRPHVQVAGERIAVEDIDFQWDPAPPAPEGKYEGFDPQAEAGEISFSVELDLPEDSESREELMQFLNRLHGDTDV